MTRPPRGAQGSGRTLDLADLRTELSRLVGCPVAVSSATTESRSFHESHGILKRIGESGSEVEEARERPSEIAFALGSVDASFVVREDELESARVFVDGPRDAAGPQVVEMKLVAGGMLRVREAYKP